MNKAVFLLVLTALIAGCQATPPTPQDDFQTGLRCRLLLAKKPITAEQVEDIRESSENGNLLCKLVLGFLYETGQGVPQDVHKAKTFYQSVAVGKAAGYEQLARMAEEGIGQAPNLVEARQFYQLAVTRPGNLDSEAKLAQFMEDGRGGPQDLKGALAHYLSAARYVDDAPWQGVQRLRDKGLVLSAEQVKHYNGIWVDSLDKSLTRKALDVEQALAKQIKSGAAGKPVTLQLIGNPGSVVPQISVLESSGDSAIDQAVLKAMSDYRFFDEPILPVGQKTWQATVSVDAGLK
ncbi:sel1 repeat family protein [Pseudomonas cucumis]|uniref:sel1 repeat family protein n=1 Tax=Pseudomonas cucumis TaxID=2954082 RepID=UPI0027360012|nr:sel1 repeat family protein [Pseudomonas cucumis]WLG92894.1 sel1 repeat family protein [Pseudomonas cucumis]